MSELAKDIMKGGEIGQLPDKHFINGAWQAPANKRLMDTFDPGRAEVFHQIPSGDAQDVDDAVTSSKQAFEKSWQHVTPAARADILRNAAQLVGQHREKLAVVEALDCGKTLDDAESDITGCQNYLNYYAGATDKLQGDTVPLGPDYLSMNILEPVGVTAHIVPWNYPLMTMLRGVAPALAAGCTAVVKPAESSTVSSLLMASILHEAGLPAGVCNVVSGTGAEVGSALCSDERVRHITFTGSVPTGSAVMTMAAKNITSVTLELGGKSPAVVLADANIDEVVEDFVWAIFHNAGQVCSAGSRLIIERSVHTEFIEKFCNRARQLTVAHQLKRPDMGPIHSAAQLAKVESYVQGAQNRGLEIVLGGDTTADPDTGMGWFFQPTVIDQVPHADCIVQEEIFGPVLAVQVADSAEQALHYANGTDFGLAACIYTQNIKSAMRMARDFDAGVVTINQYYAGGVSTPFGGNKKSGFGREKGMEALRAYCKVKNITAKL